MFILSSVNRHSDYFHFLATMSNIAINFMYKFLFDHMFSFFIGIELGKELGGHMIIIDLIFEKLPDLIKWLHQL